MCGEGGRGVMCVDVILARYNQDYSGPNLQHINPPFFNHTTTICFSSTRGREKKGNENGNNIKRERLFMRWNRQMLIFTL